MTETDPPEPGSGDGPAQSQGDPRKPRGIRSSDSEWEEVKAAAESRNVPSAEFVRDRILEIARGRAAADSTTLPDSLAPLIERTFHYTYMLATLKRDELVRHGRGDEMEELAETARDLQNRFKDTEAH